MVTGKLGNKDSDMDPTNPQRRLLNEINWRDPQPEREQKNKPIDILMQIMKQYGQKQVTPMKDQPHFASIMINYHGDNLELRIHYDDSGNITGEIGDWFVHTVPANPDAIQTLIRIMAKKLW